MTHEVRVVAPISTAEMILIGAGKISRKGKSILMGDLVVATWNLFPECFSLTGGGVQYPDSNRVIAKLSGPLGLCGRGYMDRINSSTFVLTPKGLEKIAKIKQVLAALPSDASLVPRTRRSPEQVEATVAKVLTYIKRHPHQTSAVIREALKLSEAVAVDAFTRLNAAGRIKMKRARQHATYSAAE